MKKIAFRLHQIAGLLCSVTIMIALITGALLIFENELTELFNPQRYQIGEIQDSPPMDYSKLVSELSLETGETVRRITVRPEQTDTWILETAESPKVRYYFNPYTGKIVERFEYGSSFFFKVMALHRWLFVNPAGKTIMGVSCILFTLILISGLWLWIPYSRKGLKSKLTFKKNAGKKRKLYDWHVVLGFYLLPVLLLMSVTGPTWSFPWYRTMLLNICGGESMPGSMKKGGEMQGDTKSLTDEEWSNTLAYVKGLPAFREATLDLEGNPEKEDAIIGISVNPRNAVSHKVRESYTYHSQDQEEIKSSRWSDMNHTARLRYWFYALHTGSFGGLLTKWIYLFVCLFAASLPITGFLWWKNKR
ncbi:MAG: PepSY-associated TM helix domain-containing protein [Bacteroidales bacterium]